MGATDRMGSTERIGSADRVDRRRDVPGSSRFPPRGGRTTGGSAWGDNKGKR